MRWYIPFTGVVKAEAIVEAETKAEALRKFRARDWIEQTDSEYPEVRKSGKCLPESHKEDK